MKIKWGDLIVFVIIASVIAAMFLLSLPKGENAELTAQISHNGDVLYEVDLSTVEGRKEYLLKDGNVLIVAEQGRIRFVESDCPNQICVHTGWISRANQIAACLPNRILIKLVGNSSQVDAVVQ